MTPYTDYTEIEQQLRALLRLNGFYTTEWIGGRPVAPFGYVFVTDRPGGISRSSHLFHPSAAPTERRSREQAYREAARHVLGYDVASEG